MTQQLRILLDTNILIPLQDSKIILTPSLKNFIRLAHLGGHQLLYHPASIPDIERDSNVVRRAETLNRIGQYSRLENPPSNPENGTGTSENDWCDNDIYYALVCSAVHALVTEDREIHKKAKAAGFGDKVYYIQTAENWMRRLIPENAEVSLPNIEDVFMYNLTEQLDSNFYDSLRKNYDTENRSFNDWFRDKAASGRKAWIARTDEGIAEAVCIYATQNDQIINNDGECLNGKSLKLCTFKVGELIRGRKIGELFLKAAFHFATKNHCQNIFIHTSPEQVYLIELLYEFGFEQRGMLDVDVMFVKAHPINPPNLDIPALDYARLYFPHYRYDNSVQKFLIPIKPQYHQILFPELSRQRQLFGLNSVAGNAIKQAYICHAPSNLVQPGDIVLFYRSGDEKTVTTIGIVERYETHNDATDIMQIVSRRTVYNQQEIETMAVKPTKVMLFRLIGHFNKPVSSTSLLSESIIAGKFMSITKISNESFNRLLQLTNR